MRISIVPNWHDAGQCWFSNLAKLTLPNRHEYAARHCYESRVFNYRGHYGKIWAILEAWEAADWVWWLDIDAIVTRPELSLEPLISQGGDFIATCDENGFNSGSMLIRTIPDVRKILKASIEKRSVFDVAPWPDPNALTSLLWVIRDRVRIVATE